VGVMQSVKRLHTCTVVTTDGYAGRLRRVYFDDRRWILRHLVVTFGHWLAQRDVLIPLDCVREIDAASQPLRISLNKHELAHTPGAWTERPVSQQREISIDAVYWYSVFPGSLARRFVSDNTIGPRRRDDRHLRSTAEVLGYY